MHFFIFHLCSKSFKIYIYLFDSSVRKDSLVRIQPIRISGFLLLLSAFFLVLTVTGEAQTSISGVINFYAKVTSVDGTDRVTVGDPSLFHVGDTVLIIQMKGIEIEVINDKITFGSRRNSYSAGYYEFIIISDITGNQVTFQADMLNTYDALGEVQLIRAPGFDNATVTGPLTCDPWDPVLGTGGVVAMIVGNTLTLEADIDVSGKGFLGGSPVVRASGTCYGLETAFFDDASTEGGYKGEGSATYEQVKIFLGTNYVKGMGAYFNGGGGGNGKYSGGGGGGNGGTGGNGGLEENSCGFNDIGGRGGKSIPDWIDYINLKKIFLGGGGGAGTQLTDGEGTDGGNGGGIVIIIADTLVGNGNSIIANGESVAGVATGNAGAGGGGAGGTILVEVGGYKGSNLNLEAIGGKGGAVSGSPTCTGPGGGGGGGIIWHSDADFPAEVSASVLPGVAVPGSCAPMLASPGVPGEITNNLVVPLTGFLFNSIYSSLTGMLLDTICEDEVPPLMLGTQPKGGTGPGTYTYVWESSEDKTAWSIVAGGTFQNYSPVDPLIDTTYYKRTVLDASVPQIIDESKILTIIVQPKIENYNITTDDTICYNQAPPLITSDALGPPTGGDGTGIYTYYWEDSVSAGSWNPIAGAEDETFQPPSLTQTTYYRRTVQSGIGCPKTSNVSTVTVLPLITNNDILTADQIICEGFEFGPLDAEGYPVLNGGNTEAGDYRFEWIESTDGFIWNSAYGPNTNEDYAPDTTSSTFPSTTAVQFRRIVLSGPADVCIDTSNVVTMTQWPKITNNVVPYDKEYCENDDPDPIPGSTPAGGNGVDYLFQWEKYEGSWSEISGETEEDYDPGELTDSLFYRRIVTSDVCKDTSIVDTIPVNPALQNFNIQTLSGGVDTTICFGATPNQLVPEPTTITGGDGTYSFIWEESTNGGASWAPSAGGTLEYFDPPELNATTIYRRTMISNVCTELSNEITVNVLPAITGNSFSGPVSSSVCFNTTVTFTDDGLIAGGNGSYTYKWEQSPDNVIWSPAASPNDQINYTSPDLTAQTYYRRIVKSGPSECCQDTTASQLITIDPLPTAALTPIDVTICDGDSQDLTFALTGASNWKLTYSDGFSDFIINDISLNAHNEIVTPSAMGEFTDYNYIIVDLEDGNGCFANPADLTGSAKIHVDGIPTPNAGDPADVCGLTYTLQASTDFGNGSWTFPTAVVDAADNTNPNKVVTVDSYGTHNFIWTVINGVCAPRAKDVAITFFEPPSPADAGLDTTLVPLTTEINLGGNTPLVGTGEWTNNPVDAQAIIADPSNPATLVTNLANGENRFVWTISNGPCPVETDEVIVDLFAFIIPNGFSPNGDGINDFFVISGVMDYPNELIIISRQGTQVFKVKNYQNDWDGKYSSGDDVPDDTYYYILYYTKDGTRYQHSGWLIIKR